MPLLGEAPCQCFSFGGIHTVSPGRISWIGPPLVCTRPTPEITNSVCPSGCVCHAVRAPGSKATRAELTRAGAGGVLIGSCQTVPVNQSLDARRVGREPARKISMALPLVVLKVISSQPRSALWCRHSLDKAPAAPLRRSLH